MNELHTLYDYLIQHRNKIAVDDIFSDDSCDRLLHIFLRKSATHDIGYPSELLYQENGKKYIKGNDSAALISFEHHIRIITHISKQLLRGNKNIGTILKTNINLFVNDFFWVRIHQLVGSKSFIDLLINYDIFEYILDTTEFFQLAGSKLTSSNSKSKSTIYDSLKRFLPTILLGKLNYKSKDKKTIFNCESFSLSDNKSWINLSKLSKEKADIIEARHKRIKYIIILNSIVPSIKPKGEIPDSINSVADKNAIFQFAKTILNKLIPNGFYNTPKNKVVFFQNIKKLIFIEGNQYYDWQHLLQDVKKVDPFLEEMLFWLCFRFLPTLIKQFFYVTKVNSGYDIVYYRHDDAMHFIEPLIKEYISAHLSADMITCDGANGYHNKNNGYFHCHFRPVLKNLKSPNNFRFLAVPNHRLSLGGNKDHYYFQQDYVIPINKILLHLRKTVFPKLFQDNFPAINSINDIILQFKHFKAENKDPNRKLYFIAFDARASYDSIPKEYLKTVINGMFSKLENHEFYLSNEVSVVSSQEIHTANKHLAQYQVTKQIIVNGGERYVKKRKLNDFIEQTASSSSNIKVVQEFYKTRKYTLEDVKYMVAKELDSTIVNIGKHCYYRVNGIFQGLYFSSILSNMFYDSLVRKYKDILIKEGEFFIRFMDDFLIITDDYCRIGIIKDFLLQGGLKDNYNLEINLEKLQFSKVEATKNNLDSKFSFAGLDFDIDEMSITKSSDSLKILRYDHLSSFKAIFNKLIMIFKLRLSSGLIFSLELNSISTILKYIDSVCDSVAKMLLNFVVANKKLTTKDIFFKKFINNLLNLLAKTINSQNQFKFFKSKNYYRFKRLCFEYKKALIEAFQRVFMQKKGSKICCMFLQSLAEIGSDD